MKSIILIALFFGTVFGANAATNSCAEQRADINRKLEIAKDGGNIYAERGLKTALSNVDTYCDDAQQNKRADREVSQKTLKVKKAELDLQSAEEERDEAQTDGRDSRYREKKLKVEEKKQRLESAGEELKQAQKDNERLNK